MTSDPADPDTPDIQAVDTEASALMKQGIGLMETRQPEHVAEALACFDRALDLRSRLPIESIPRLRYNLAACWLNRADALVFLGGRAHHSMALRAYDEGIALMRSLAPGDDPRYPRRLAIGYQNLGLALQQEGGNLMAAVRAFRSAVEALERDEAAAVPDRARLLGAIWLNLALTYTAMRTMWSIQEARDAAQRAVALAAAAEQDEADAAEIGLKARHILCQGLAVRLSSLSATDDPMPAVHEATDAVDGALALSRTWEQRGEVRFRPIAYDLFRFGARVYAAYQPQFLEEFVRENMDPRHSCDDYVQSEEMQSAAAEALALTAPRTEP